MKERTMNAVHEIYPMPSFATLEVSDIEASARFYEKALGFTSIFSLPGPASRPLLVHLRWAKYADLLLSPARAAYSSTPGIGIGLSFSVSDGTVDAIADRARRQGATIASEPGDRPWNARDFTVLDPDGFRLTFTKGPVDKDRTFDAVMKGAVRQMT
jgi:catechol 2,3-dioxygenase-like lactoylglutathione lyase family enzyme